MPSVDLYRKCLTEIRISSMEYIRKYAEFSAFSKFTAASNDEAADKSFFDSDCLQRKI